MRVARVVTNETCNQNCAFCNARRPEENPLLVAPRAVEQRVSLALSRAKEVVFTGGEPTLRRDLERLIAVARDRGAVAVILETNAVLIDLPRAEALRDAGVTRARVHVPAWGVEYERITRDPGAFSQLLRGVNALREAGISVCANLPVLTSTRSGLAALPALLLKAGFDSVRLVVPHQSPEPALLVAPSEAAEAVTAVAEACRRAGLSASLDPDSAIPPCIFPQRSRVAHLFALTPGGHEHPNYERLPVCGTCGVRDRCPGVPKGRQKDFAAVIRPITKERLKRRLSLIQSEEHQIERELFQDDLYRRDNGAIVAARIVRVNFHCNQACHFCFVSTHLPPPARAQVIEALRPIAEAGGVLVLSGGEPTLNPDLPEYVRKGKSLGASEVEVQTNAIRLAREGYASELKSAGVDQFFVSVHGSTSPTAEAVTQAPGTFKVTLAGVDEAVRAGVRVRLNFVICKLNFTELPDLVRLISQRWPAGVSLTVSFVAASTDMVPKETWLIPRYIDALPALKQALALGEELGVPIGGFESMCGIPLCLVPEAVRDYISLAEIPEGFDGGEFVFADACEACDLRSRCFGLRRGYNALYGAGELTPVRLTPPL